MTVVDGRGPLRVAALVATHGPAMEPICRACVAHLPDIAGVGVTMMVATAAQQMRFSSDAVSTRVEQLQLVLGEGPCQDAALTGSPVLAEDLRTRAWQQRWPAFASAAVQAGAVAVFALPLRAGGVAVGVLDLYRTSAGRLAGQDLADALVFAEAVTDLLLAESLPDGERRSGGAAGSAAAGETGEADDAVGHQRQRAVVHQATGMLSVQLRVPAEEAFARLRAHAFAVGLDLDRLAADVVARRLRFDSDAGR